VEYLTIDIQTKLLRFLQDGEFYPADGVRPIKSNARFIATTSRSESELLDDKKFRQDFKFAISIFPISIPALNGRGVEDIIMMSEHFLRTFAVNENKKVKSFSFSVEEMLGKFDWKGNVRQLKNYIFRAVILCDDSVLQPEHFPQILNAEGAADRQILGIRDEVVHIFKEDGTSKSLADIEEEIAKKLMTKFYGNISEVAKQLNIARSTLYRKLKIDEKDIGNDDKKIATK
jgi:DNA-binding NtrC family response regulator